MLELSVMALFAAMLFVCILLDLSILYALTLGFFLFTGYGLYRRHSLKTLLSAALSGVKTVKNILVTFLLISIITAVWRMSGTIAFIVYHSTRFCSPQAMVLICFLLCCLISALTGTAFGTSATMGVICVTMANSMGVPIVYSGGAVLAGSYFGDRCSPMSTSALLVSSLTGTDLFKNIAAMVKSSVVPFVLSCALYVLLGLSFEARPDSSGINSIFADNFSLHPAVVIPALVIVLFSLFKINVKLTMAVSILCACLVSLFIQKAPLPELFTAALLGFHPENEELYRVLSGGGIVSMANVFAVVCLSSSYAGIFQKTGLLYSIQHRLEKLSRVLSPYGCVLISSVLTGIISCNQTLTIILSHQLCAKAEPEPYSMALHLENSAVVIPPLIPWSIACGVTLGSVAAPVSSIFAAFYLYLLCIWTLFVNLKKHKKASPCQGRCHEVTER